MSLNCLFSLGFKLLEIVEDTPNVLFAILAVLAAALRRDVIDDDIFNLSSKDSTL